MPWYYVKSGQRVGPVEDAELELLARQGVIHSGTLVWKAGMLNWMKFGETELAAAQVPSVPLENTAEEAVAEPLKLAAGAESYSPTGSPRALARVGLVSPFGTTGGPGHPPFGTADESRLCSSCGRIFPTSDLIQYEEHALCGGCKPAFFRGIKEGRLPGATQLAYAGFWIRGSAAVIDYLVVAVCSAIAICVLWVGAALTGGDPKTMATGGAGPVFLVLYYLVSLALPVAYYIGMWSRYGATLGKRAVGIRIVNQDGSPISLSKAVGRYFAWILSMLVSGLTGGLIVAVFSAGGSSAAAVGAIVAVFTCWIPFYLAALDVEKRALHDHVCGTRVVRSK